MKNGNDGLHEEQEIKAMVSLYRGRLCFKGETIFVLDHEAPLWQYTNC